MKFDTPSEIIDFLVRIVMFTSILNVQRIFSGDQLLPSCAPNSEGVLVAFVIGFMLSDALAVFKPLNVLLGAHTTHAHIMTLCTKKNMLIHSFFIG